MLLEAWTLAIEALSLMEMNQLGERLALAKAATQLRIQDPKTMGLAHKMVFETFKKRNLIDFLLSKVIAPRTLGDLSLGLRAFLRLYLHESRILEADLEEASKKARIGRSLLGWREFKDIEETLGEILSVQIDHALQGLGDEEKVGLQTYNPSWFVKYCFKLLGRNDALGFLEKTTETPPTYLRVNTLKAPVEKLLKKIENDGVIVEPVKQLDFVYRVVKSRVPLMRTRSFRDGFYYLQDKSSCVAVEVAHPQGCSKVLEVCAAPGAKTSHLAQLMKNRGVIYSIDYSRRRLGIWKKETKRMGVKIAESMIADARRILPINLSPDLVILDPPCTSTGTFSRTPSAKWRLTKRSVMGMAMVQLEMLDRTAELLREGTFLVYSTCSITIEENEMVIEKILKIHPELKLVETSPKIGTPGLRGKTKCQRLYPHMHDSNGFFVAKLFKESG